jgi:hypothetical protein
LDDVLESLFFLGGLLDPSFFCGAPGALSC